MNASAFDYGTHIMLFLADLGMIKELNYPPKSADWQTKF
jgi:hypothetical protein